MKVILAQKKHRLGDKEYNLKIIEETAASTDSELLVFPEMFLTGYGIGDLYWTVAEEIPGPSSQRISDAAKENDTTIICGMPERPVPDIGRLYNSALVATPDGKLDAYRKTYLANFGPFDDMRYFKPESELPLFDTPLGKLGVVICYDLFFPEITKYYAMNGADMIVCISASPSVTREFFEGVLLTRAIETTSFVLYANMLGREEQLMFWGGDTAISPKGRQLAKGPYFEEALVELDIDMEELPKARTGRPVLSDTRPDVLVKLLE